LVGIRELSRRLDDYIGAVSRALNDRADVNPLTRDRLRVYPSCLDGAPWSRVALKLL
jgi:hypothetical protein